MPNGGARTGTRHLAGRSCVAAGALLLLGGVECRAGSDTIGSPDANCAPRAQALVPAAGDERRPNPRAEALLSGLGARTPEQWRVLNPFLACGDSPEGDSICDLWSEVDAAWNARDAQAFSRLFAEDATFRFVRRGQSLDGRQTILEHFGELFPRYAPDLRHHSRIKTIRALAPGVFTADGEVDILRPSGNRAGTVLRTFAIFAMMCEKDEDWSIHALRIYELSPPDAD